MFFITWNTDIVEFRHVAQTYLCIILAYTRCNVWCEQTQNVVWSSEYSSNTMKIENTLIVYPVNVYNNVFAFDSSISISLKSYSPLRVSLPGSFSDGTSRKRDTIDYYSIVRAL